LRAVVRTLVERLRKRGRGSDGKHMLKEAVAKREGKIKRRKRKSSKHV